jgi:hypothetical protein
LHVRLPALRAHKHAFDIMHFPSLFHAPTPYLFWPRMP